MKLCYAPDARPLAPHIVLREAGVPLPRYLAAIQSRLHTRNAPKAEGLLK
jgi:hypothetical protein